MDKPSPDSNQPPQEPLLSGSPLDLSPVELAKEATVSPADIARALAKGRRLPYLKAMIDAKPTNKGRE